MRTESEEKRKSARGRGETGRETDRDRQTERETKRQRQRHTDRERDKETETERGRAECGNCMQNNKTVHYGERSPCTSGERKLSYPTKTWIFLISHKKNVDISTRIITAAIHCY